MKKNKILKVCNNYTEHFEKNKEISRIKHLEYFDFANLHLDTYSNLLFDIHQLNGQEQYIEHSKSLKKFITDNDSKINHNKSNFLSRLNNTELIGILLSVFTLFCSLSYYFGTEKVNGDYINTLTKLNKLKDSTIINKPTKFTDTITYKKTDVSNK